MNTSEAKLILRSWRASGADAGDPRFAEALRAAGRDAELADWFATEQALDAAIGSKLRDLAAPESLREEILSGHAADYSVPVSRRRLALALALAAAVAFLATVAAAWLLMGGGGRSFSSYQARMVENLSGLRLDFAAVKLADVQDWLALKGGLVNYEVPQGLQGRQTIGCKTLSWRGRPVSLICFSVAEGRVAHLFIVPRSARPETPAGDPPQFAELKGWMTATWSEGQNVYMVVQRGDEAALRRLLGFKA